MQRKNVKKGGKVKESPMEKLNNQKAKKAKRKNRIKLETWDASDMTTPLLRSEDEEENLKDEPISDNLSTPDENEEMPRKPKAVKEKKRESPIKIELCKAEEPTRRFLNPSEVSTLLTNSQADRWRPIVSNDLYSVT